MARKKVKQKFEKINRSFKGQHHSPETEFKKGHKIPREWIEKRRSYSKENNPNFKYDKSNPPLCKCGCGQYTRFNYTLKRFCDYITGHNSKGNKNPNWREGKSFEPYTTTFNKELKEQIKRRDNYICQAKDIGKCKGILIIHHIDFNKKNNSQNNLITLCLRHNSLINFNREHWINYFKMKMFIRELFDPQNILIFNKDKKLIKVENVK